MIFIHLLMKPDQRNSLCCHRNLQYKIHLRLVASREPVWEISNYIWTVEMSFLGLFVGSCQKFRLVSRDALCWMIESSENIWQPSLTLYLCKPLYCKPASHHINELPKKRLWFGWRNETSSKVVNGRGKPHLRGRGPPEKKKATYLLFWHQSTS